MAYANQKVIKINKRPLVKPFYYTKMENLQQAMQVINKVSTLKMFLYLSKNEDKIDWELSSKDFMNWTGLSKNMSDSAIDELIELGYIIQPKEGVKRYSFFDNIEDAKAEKERFKNAETSNQKETLEEYPGFVF